MIAIAVKSDHPISPCGMCRQALLEYETRIKKPIRLILSGQEGKILYDKNSKSVIAVCFYAKNWEYGCTVGLVF